MLLDNKNHGKVISELRANIQPSTKLSVLCGLFSIYGYATLKKELVSVSEARLIISRWDDSYLQTLSGQSSEMRLKNHLDQARIARECAVWLQKQAQVKSLLGVGAGQNLFHLANQNGEAFGIQPMPLLSMFAWTRKKNTAANTTSRL